MNEICRLEGNGLKLIELYSRAEPVNDIGLEEIDALLRGNFADKAYVVVWLDYKVLIGTWENGDCRFYADEKFELKYVQRLRVFDQRNELLAWRTSGGLKCRLRKDDDPTGDKTDVVVAHQLLFGTKGKRLNELYAEINEDRGTKLTLPLRDISFNRKDKIIDSVFIKTHNYVKTNAVYQATYFDCRFVAFTDGKTVLS